MIDISFNVKVKGWVIVNPYHPTSEKEMIIASTFSRTRSEAIKNFIQGSGSDWSFWKRKFNYRCVKAESVLTAQIKE